MGRWGHFACKYLRTAVSALVFLLCCVCSAASALLSRLCGLHSTLLPLCCFCLCSGVSVCLLWCLCSDQSLRNSARAACLHFFRRLCFFAVGSDEGDPFGERVKEPDFEYFGREISKICPKKLFRKIPFHPKSPSPGTFLRKNVRGNQRGAERRRGSVLVVLFESRPRSDTTLVHTWVTATFPSAER
jgi:hypothetical protein